MNRIMLALLVPVAIAGTPFLNQKVAQAQYSECSTPVYGGSYISLETTSRINAVGNPIHKLCLYANGQLQGGYDAVTGRAHTQNKNRNKSGTQAPLPDGTYTFGPYAVKGKVYEAGTKFLPIHPQFKTNRTALGIHYDPSFGKSNGQDGTGGCLALTNKADLDKVLEFVSTYQPSHLDVDIQ